MKTFNKRKCGKSILLSHGQRCWSFGMRRLRIGRMKSDSTVTREFVRSSKSGRATKTRMATHWYTFLSFSHYMLIFHCNDRCYLLLLTVEWTMRLLNDVLKLILFINIVSLSLHCSFTRILQVDVGQKLKCQAWSTQTCASCAYELNLFARCVGFRYWSWLVAAIAYRSSCWWISGMLDGQNATV